MMKFCRYCGAALDGRSPTCPRCQRPLLGDEETLVAVKEVPATQHIPHTPLPDTELLHQSVASHAARIADLYQALDQLRQDMQEQLKLQHLILQQQLETQKREPPAASENESSALAEASSAQSIPARKGEVAMSEAVGQQPGQIEPGKVLPAVEAPAEEEASSKHRRGRIIRDLAMGTFLSLAALAFLTSLTFIVLYAKLDHRSDALALASTVLVVFGGFYLATDLLGGRDGPLARLSAYVTHALIGILGASLASLAIIVHNFQIVSPVALLQAIIANPQADVTTLETDQDFLSLLTIRTRVALICLFWGALIGVAGYIFSRPYRLRKRWLRILGEFIFSMACWFVFWGFYFHLFLASYLKAYPPLIDFLVQIVFTFVPAIVTFGFIRLYRGLVISKLVSAKARHLILYWTIFPLSTLIVLSSIALPMFLLIGSAWTSDSLAWPVAFAFGFALSGTIASVIAPFATAWIDDLDEQRLGAFGLAIVSIGTIMNVIPALFELIAR